MAFDINQIRITGTVEQFDTINTRTGTPMIKASVRCFKELFTVVAFERKLPCQADSLKVEFLAYVDRYSAGVRSPRESCGRCSLYSIIHQ